MSEPVQPAPTTVRLRVDGREVEVPDDGGTLLHALRDRLGLRTLKDGCSPQGQCGCCTVLVDGAPRVSCVTPTRRVSGREITTVDGLQPEVRACWGEALTATGGSQCGFCTPGILLRLEGLRTRTGAAALTDRAQVGKALQAHLCRCTGWQTILEAAETVGCRLGSGAPAAPEGAGSDRSSTRDLEAAARRAEVEGGAPQQVGPQVALGSVAFADDGAPADALVAVLDPQGSWVVGDSVAEARQAAGKVQGRRTTVPVGAPLSVPEGPWTATLRTSWVEPGYLETDASWCAPGGEPAGALANGGAFGAKTADALGAVARELADRHGRAVRVLWSREDVVRHGRKRPPFAGGADANGRGSVVVARTPGIRAAIAAVAPGLEVTEVDLPGPPTSVEIRGAGWVEALLLVRAARGDRGPVTAPGGGRAEAEVADGRITVRVEAGEVLDEVVLRSYAIGAAHMAFGWVTSEGLSVGEDGTVHDLTIRSFGIPRAVDTPPIDVEVVPGAGPAVNGSDAVFAAVASAVWFAQGCPGELPTRGAWR